MPVSPPTSVVSSSVNVPPGSGFSTAEHECVAGVAFGGRFADGDLSGGGAGEASRCGVEPGAVRESEGHLTHRPVRRPIHAEVGADGVQRTVVVGIECDIEVRSVRVALGMLTRIDDFFTFPRAEDRMAAHSEHRDGKAGDTGTERRLR